MLHESRWLLLATDTIRAVTLLDLTLSFRHNRAEKYVEKLGRVCFVPGGSRFSCKELGATITALGFVSEGSCPAGRWSRDR